MYTTSGLSTDTHKSFPPMGEKCFKRVLTYLECTKYHEINIGHSHI